MISLKSRQWKAFKIEDVFDVMGTKTTHPSKLINGVCTPRITCAATNNGFDGLYGNEPTEKGGVLTIDSATVGYVSYQAKDFIATDHVEKLSLKTAPKLGYLCGLFIKTMIDHATIGKYGYGYKFSQTRIKRQTILLPITDVGNPDWDFMEQYMKGIEQKQITEYLDIVSERLKPQTAAAFVAGSHNTHR